MEISDERKEKIWRELIETRRFENDIKPQERSKKMLMDEYNMTINQVESFVKKMMKMGFIVKRSTVVDGKKCVVYSLVYSLVEK